jgi:transcriptional regulator with XRE-family HTH domain
MTGCKQGDLSDIERGKGRDGPSYKTLKSIATALHVELPVNPQPPVTGIVMIGDEAQVNFAETAYDQLYPLYTVAEWAHVGGRVKTQLEKIWATMDEAGGPADATTCQIINVGPSQQVRFRCDRGFSVIGRVRGGGDVKVHKPVYRFQASEPGDAVAILSGDSQLVVNTAADESCVFMAVPAHLLLG